MTNNEPKEPTMIDNIVLAELLAHAEANDRDLAAELELGDDV